MHTVGVCLHCFHYSHVHDSTQSAFQLRDGACAFTPTVFVSPVQRELRFYAVASSSTPPQVPELRIQQRILSVVPALPEVHFCPSSQSKLAVCGDWIPLLLRSTSSLPEAAPSPEGFHRREVFLGVGSWLGKKAETEISIWICEVGSVSCEHSHRPSHCFRAPYDGAANISAGTDTSIHHSIPRLLLVSSQHLKQTVSHFFVCSFLYELAEL